MVDQLVTRRIIRLLVVFVMSAVAPFEAHGSKQAPSSAVPPLSLLVDVGYDVSPLTGNPPAHQEFLNLCNGLPGQASTGHGSQNLHPDANGNFDEIWSLTTPTVHVVGTVTTTSFSAAINCRNGPGTGSISGSGNIHGYTGSWSFTISGQAYSGHADMTRRCYVADAGGPYEIENNSGISDPLQLNGAGSNACDNSAPPGHYEWRINDVVCTFCADKPAPYLAGLDLPLVLTSPTRNTGDGKPTPVSLTFTDLQGRSSISRTTVTVWDNRPFAVYAASPDIVTCGQSVTFDAHASFHGSPKLHQIVGYKWGFTDEPQLIDGITLTRTFNRPGVKYFFLSVTDDQGKGDLAGTIKYNGTQYYAYVRVRSNAPPFTDEVLTPGAIGKAAYINELRARINGVRAQFWLGPYTYTDAFITAGTTTIKAQHIVEMRTALAEAYARSTASLAPYTDPNLAAGAPLKTAHVDELRTAVLVLECRGSS